MYYSSNFCTKWRGCVAYPCHKLIGTVAWIYCKVGIHVAANLGMSGSSAIFSCCVVECDKPLPSLALPSLLWHAPKALLLPLPLPSNMAMVRTSGGGVAKVGGDNDSCTVEPLPEEVNMMATAAIATAISCYCCCCFLLLCQEGSQCISLNHPHHPVSGKTNLSHATMLLMVPMPFILLL